MCFPLAELVFSLVKPELAHRSWQVFWAHLRVTKEVRGKVVPQGVSLSLLMSLLRQLSTRTGISVLFEGSLLKISVALLFSEVQHASHATDNLHNLSRHVTSLSPAKGCKE